METQLENVLDSCVHAPLTTGAIVINDLSLCIASRGELEESDVAPISDLIATGTNRSTEAKGELPYRGKRLQFHKTPQYTLALLRNNTPSTPPGSIDGEGGVTVSASMGSLRSAETGGTVRGLTSSVVETLPDQ